MSDMARINFSSVFRKNTDGSFEPTQRVRVGGAEFGPGVRFNRGVSVGGIDFMQLIDREFEVETDGGVMILRGAY